MTGDDELLPAERKVQEALGGFPLDFRAMAVVSNLFRSSAAIRRHMEAKVLAADPTAISVEASGCRSSCASSSAGREASTMPNVMTTSRSAVGTPSVSPATIAITAAIAPSVEATGETMPTLPSRSASYTSASPITFMAPDRSSQPPTSASSVLGMPSASASGSTITSPVSITHARTEPAPICRLVRLVHNVAVPHISAAPRPPRIANTGVVSSGDDR